LSNSDDEEEHRNDNDNFWSIYNASISNSDNNYKMTKQSSSSDCCGGREERHKRRKLSSAVANTKGGGDDEEEVVGWNEAYTGFEGGIFCMYRQTSSSSSTEESWGRAKNNGCEGGHSGATMVLLEKTASLDARAKSTKSSTGAAANTSESAPEEETILNGDNSPKFDCATEETCTRTMDRDERGQFVDESDKLRPGIDGYGLDAACCESFFLRDPYTPEEFNQVGTYSTKQVQKAMDFFETKGLKVYRNWSAKSQQTSVAAAKKEQTRNQQTISDAKIDGAPRVYQQRLFEIACRQNSIIHLGTGAGKTLIALMTIRHFSGALTPEEGKQTLFLVPSVALAVQQSIVLRANLPLTVQVACFASSRSEKARKDLQICQILVATHGAINDLLMHYGDMFKMERFNLLVIDECHYAIGSHSYATLMKRFYHTLPLHKRPRILGLTASPLVKVKATHDDIHLGHMLSKLEHILSSSLVSLPADATATDVMHKAAEEKHVPYLTFIPYSPLPSLARYKLHHSRTRECRHLFKVYEELGPLALSIYCQTLTREVSRNTFERERRDQFQSLRTFLYDLSIHGDRLCRRCPHGGRSDKLLALEELLEKEIEDQGGTETVCLVFVERRITALALSNYFLFRLKQRENGNWIGAKDARKLAPKTRPSFDFRLPSTPTSSNLSAKTRKSTRPDSSSLSPYPQSSVQDTSPAKNTDPFADTLDGALAIAVTVGDHMSIRSGEDECHQVAVGGLTSAAALICNQFIDADEEEEGSQHVLQQFLTGIRVPAATGPGTWFSQHETRKNIINDQDHHGTTNKANCEPSSHQFLVADGQSEDEEEGPLEPAQGLADEKCASRNFISDGSNVGFIPPKEEESCSGMSKDKDSIRCQALVRDCTQIFKSLNMGRKLTGGDDEATRNGWLHQEFTITDVLAKLRRGEINCLIATSGGPDKSVLFYN